MTDRQTDLLWNYLVKKLAFLDDRNYTARLIYERVKRIFGP